MTLTTVPLERYEDERGNRIEYDGPRNEDIKVTFRGSNNVAKVHPQAQSRRLTVDFNSNNGTFELGANPQSRGFSAGVRVGEDATVRIGKGVSSTAGVTISAVEGVTVDIGDDVMFADQCQVRADDGHPIFDVRTEKRINAARDIRIGPHVWVGFGGIVFGGAVIGEGSVIGARSIVKRRVPNNVIAVGSPARVVRKNIAWERPHLGLVEPFYKPDASTVARSPFWNMTAESGAPSPTNILGRIVRRVWRGLRRAVKRS